MKHVMVLFIFVVLLTGTMLSQTTPKKHDATRSENVLSSSVFFTSSPNYLCNDGTTESVPVFFETDFGKEKFGPYCFHDIGNLFNKFLKLAVEYKELKFESKEEKIKLLIRELNEVVGKD